MTIYTTTFQEVKVRGLKSGLCKCMKKRTRRETFCHTINPYNVRVGTRIQKSYDEVLADVKAERDAWIKLPITCEKCEGK